MLEKINQKLMIGMSGLALLVGCASAQDPVVEKCCEKVNCGNSYTCDPTEDKQSRAYSSQYNCIKVEQDSGISYYVCCACEYHEKVYGGKGM